MILGVIFDMDGVLGDSEPFIAAAMVRMFGEKGATSAFRMLFCRIFNAFVPDSSVARVG
jgi:beta-phosphoglucomutase-like phosphatase (HAD superfamily)